MQVEFTRLSNQIHRFAIERRDGSREAVQLETRSLLVHDLTHFAVEAEAGVDGGFYGLLAAGMPLVRLNDRENPPPDPMLMAVEQVVGPMQILAQGRGSAQLLIGMGLRLGEVPVDAAFIDAVQARMRRLLGQWKGTPFHASMRLTWPE
jgi:hypothetical protein